MSKKFNEMFNNEEVLNEISVGDLAAGAKAVAGAAVKGAATAVANKALGAVGLPNVQTIKGIFDAGVKAKQAKADALQKALAPDMLAPIAKQISNQIAKQISGNITGIIKTSVPIAVKAYNDDKEKKIKSFMIPDANGKAVPVTVEAWVATVVENAIGPALAKIKTQYEDPTKSALTPDMIKAKFPPTPPPETAAPAAAGQAQQPAPGTPTAPAAGAAPAAAK